jgi:hypothetical protein
MKLIDVPKAFVTDGAVPSLPSGDALALRCAAVSFLAVAFPPRKQMFSARQCSVFAASRLPTIKDVS